LTLDGPAPEYTHFVFSGVVVDVHKAFGVWRLEFWERMDEVVELSQFHSSVGFEVKEATFLAGALGDPQVMLLHGG
jgi:hypothetical protein